MLSFLSKMSKLLSSEKINNPQKILDHLHAIKDEPIRNREVERISDELSEMDFQKQVNFVIDVLDWCISPEVHREINSRHWAIYRILSDVLIRVREYSSSQKRDFVSLCLNWFESHPKDTGNNSYFVNVRYSIERKIDDFIKQGDYENEEDVFVFLNWLINSRNFYLNNIGVFAKHLKTFLKTNSRTELLTEKIIELADVVSQNHQKDVRKKAEFLRELVGIVNEKPSIVPGEAWADTAISEILPQTDHEKSVWIQLLDECQKVGGSAPSAKWLKSANELIEKIGVESFKSHILKWFPLVDKPRTQQIETWSEWSPNPNLMINDINADILRGLVWLCGEFDDAEMARSLCTLAISAYKKVPKIGPRCVRLGNACVYALGKMETQGVAQLALLKIKVKFGTAQKGIEKALNAAAEKAGISAEELGEMSMPTYGLTEVGVLREQFGDFTAELTITGTNAAEIRWTNADGKPQKSVPKFVKENHAKDLKKLNQAFKDIKKMLPAQRDRIENLYLEQKFRDFKTWRERYLDHPLVGTLARRMIWRFDEMTTAIWHDGKLVDSSGSEMNFFDDSRVEVWHPLHSTTAEVLEWRDFLVKNEIKQPFKQAHREIYLLTDAERNTRIYSNRFAAHIIKQHQFNALCAVRGWKSQLRLMVDDSYPPPSRYLEKYNLRAEFWVESIGDNYGTDTTESGTYLYLATDQVRFYPINARQLHAHAAGGGYLDGWMNRGEIAEPLPLEQIPPLVLSEILRDVDLFVGVGSIGNDPNWMDGGNETRHTDYWQSYSFGDLTETAKTRRDILSKLIPRLKIASRSTLDDKFLTVRGDLRSYKIHLGSGNILMSPNDQYLCIVASSSAENFGGGKVFLPFEGDRTLSIILSKAFLLAEDTKITDPTITRQLKI